jgi:valyl-tRNA synthetase
MSPTEELPKTYDFAETEAQITRLWHDSAAFAADPDQRPRAQRYVIMMPLPNITGALHMGHALNNALQDLLIRWHRMQGDNTLWMPGTDHAGIATQAVIEKRLKELEGQTRHDVGRDGLVERIWRWKDQYQARIIGQLQRMGFSCDWRRHRFTMDAVCARAVRHAFFRMFADGLIVRGERLINWDVHLQTSVSDDEVYHETVQGYFWQLRYPVIEPRPGEPSHVVVATTRPETLLGDTAVAVHPEPAKVLQQKIDALEHRLTHTPSPVEQQALQLELTALRQRQVEVLPKLELLASMASDGRLVQVPLMKRSVPLILDEWAKPELGTGCVKITPAHDPNDYDVWRRHQGRLDIINVLQPSGQLNARAGAYQGLDRYEARQKVVTDLEQQGLLESVEAREIEVGHSDRSKTPVEPYLSKQWFVRMGDIPGGVSLGDPATADAPSYTGHSHSAGLVQAAIEVLESGQVRVHPERFCKSALDWLREKRDWPISRQLWWGHQIPIWSRSGPWSVLRGLDLRPLLQHAPGKVAIRVQRDDGEDSVRLESAQGWDKLNPEFEPEALVRIDVCLLDDQAELVAAVEALGLERDPDVLDTWFSSALWPLSTLGWPDPATAAIDPDNAPLAAVDGQQDCLDYYYPGSCLVTAREILTLWVARMIIAGLYLRGQVPFRDVFIHANILDGKGERMSKSKGNGIDPVDILDQFGTDAMRYVLYSMQTGNQDIRLPVTAVCPQCQRENALADTEHGRSIFTYVCTACGSEFDVLGTVDDLPRSKPTSSRFDQGKAFCTKMWNSARFVLGRLAERDSQFKVNVDALELEDRWILDRTRSAIASVEAGLNEYNPAAAVQSAREFFWGDLCDWYLELIKPRLSEGEPADKQQALAVLAFVFDQTLRLFQPFVPFITEALWQKLNALCPARSLSQDSLSQGILDQGLAAEPSTLLATASWPKVSYSLDEHSTQLFATWQQLARGVREAKASAQVSPRHNVAVKLAGPEALLSALEESARPFAKLVGISSLNRTSDGKRPAGAAVIVLDELSAFVLDIIDDAAERSRLRSDQQRLSKEVALCQKKLENPKFVDRAPTEVVEEQRNRLAQYRSQLATVTASLAQLTET